MVVQPTYFNIIPNTSITQSRRVFGSGENSNTKTVSDVLAANTGISVPVSSLTDTQQIPAKYYSEPEVVTYYQTVWNYLSDNADISNLSGKELAILKKKVFITVGKEVEKYGLGLSQLAEMNANIDLLKKYGFNEKGVHVDFGNGPGAFVMLLAAKYPNLLAIGQDIANNHDQTRKTTEKNTKDLKLDNAKFIGHTMDKQLFKPESIDSMSEFSASLYLTKEELKNYFKNAHAALKEDGVFLLGVLAPHKPDNEYSEEDLNTLSAIKDRLGLTETFTDLQTYKKLAREAGFEIIEEQPLTDQFVNHYASVSKQADAVKQKLLDMGVPEKFIESQIKGSATWAKNAHLAGYTKLILRKIAK